MIGPVSRLILTTLVVPNSKKKKKKSTASDKRSQSQRPTFTAAFLKSNYKHHLKPHLIFDFPQPVVLSP
jgi:hypothetical protein